jgi:hypothetical protein
MSAFMMCGMFSRIYNPFLWQVMAKVSVDRLMGRELGTWVL